MAKWLNGRISKMPKLTAAEVDHIALLARLELTDDEKARYAEQLSAILDYAAELMSVNVDDIPPTATVLDARNVMRPEDISGGSLPHDAALANAPRTDGASFEVQATLDNSD